MPEVSFPGTDFVPVEVPVDDELSFHLDAENSPLLFGCRTGICGTCLSEVLSGELPDADEDELEILELHAPDNPKARLACQLKLAGDVALRHLGG